MKRVRTTKEEHKANRREYLQWWQGLSVEEKTKHIEENKAKHAKAFAEKQKKHEAFKARVKKGIAKLQEAEAVTYWEHRSLYSVRHPAKRDKETGEIVRSAVMECNWEVDKTFTVSLGVRVVKEVKEKNLQRLHVAFSIRNPKDRNDAKIAKMHLGERMERGSKFSFEFNTHLASPKRNENEINKEELELLCWAEFNSYLRRTDTVLPPKFIRSWTYDISYY